MFFGHVPSAMFVMLEYEPCCFLSGLCAVATINLKERVRNKRRDFTYSYFVQLAWMLK